MFNLSDYNQTLVSILANEHISILYDTNTSIASMDLESRIIRVNPFILTVKYVNAMERLLVHEIGHALFTPNYSSETVDGCEIKRLFECYGKTIVNLVEDIRIENLLRDKFPGINTLLIKGFYSLDVLIKEQIGESIWDIDRNSNLFDRVNIFCKSNNNHPIFFSAEEQVIVDQLPSLKEVNQLDYFIKELIKLSEVSKSLTESSSLKTIHITKGFSKCAVSDAIDSMKSSLFRKHEDWIQLEKNKVTDKIYICTKDDISIPKIISNKEFTDKLPSVDVKLSKIIDTWYTRCNNNAEILQTEFCRKQSAFKFRDVNKHKTGVLDLSRIASYKTSNRLFKLDEKHSKQKNHELVILLDWSGSISDVLSNLIIEAISLVIFCRKVNIPCTVYAFCKYCEADDKTNDYLIKGLFWIELLSTKVVNFNTTCKKLLAESYYGPCQLPLGNTPLYESIFKLPQLLEKKISPLKRTSLVIISDGVSDLCFNYYNLKTHTLLDPLTKTTIDVADINNNSVFQRLKQLFPTLSILTIHIASSEHNCIFNNGFIPYEDVKKLKCNIATELKNKSLYVKDFNWFKHLIVKLDETIKQTDHNLVKDNVITKKIAKTMLSCKLGLSKEIYKHVIDCIA